MLARVHLEGPRGVGDHSSTDLGHATLNSNYVHIVIREGYYSHHLAKITIHEFGHAIFGIKHTPHDFNLKAHEAGGFSRLERTNYMYPILSINLEVQQKG